MANLADHIRNEIARHNLPTIFKVSEVTSLNAVGDSCHISGQRYPKSSVREILANQSVGPGDRKGESVKRGQAALFIKHGRATYSLIEEPVEEDDELSEKGHESAKSLKLDSVNQDVEKIGCAFVQYLREKPFRQLITRGLKQTWYPASGPVCGWNARLREYVWRKKSWAATSSILGDFSTRLNALNSSSAGGKRRNVALEKDAAQIYADIRYWGNPKASDLPGSLVLDRLEEVWGAGITKVDSTLTKLYALARPHEYVIFDSRVAAAIVSIAEDIYRYRTLKDARVDTVAREFYPQFPNLGYVAGAGGTRTRGMRWSGWPNAYMQVGAQLDANRLCQSIVKCLNTHEEDERSDWNLREVEAVLFMEGY